MPQNSKTKQKSPTKKYSRLLIVKVEISEVNQYSKFLFKFNKSKTDYFLPQEVTNRFYYPIRNSQLPYISEHKPPRETKNNP